MEIGKKAQGDSMSVGFFLLLIIIVGYVFYTIINALGNVDIMQQHNESIKIVNDAKDLFTGLDFAIPGILLAVNLGSLISLYFLRSHPILAVIFMILIPITIIIAAATSNAYTSMETTLDLASQFPISHTLMSLLPLILLGMDILGGIMLFFDIGAWVGRQ